MKIFETHKRANVTFLVIRQKDQVHIVDENGCNYGSWFDWNAFNTATKTKPSMATSLGKCTVAIWQR